MSEGAKHRPQKQASGAANPTSGDNNAQKARQGKSLTTMPTILAVPDISIIGKVLYVFL